MKIKTLGMSLLTLSLVTSIMGASVLPEKLTVTEEVKAADASSAFNGIRLAKGLKEGNNPCITQKYSADPCAMEYNGKVYVYSTNDGTVNPNGGYVKKNTYEQVNQINVMSSEDMVNWTDNGTINVAGRNGAAKWATNSWAPCAAHKKINGKEKFFLYFANNAGGIGVLTSDSPTGPWKDPINRPLITKSTPNCGNVTWLFDPAVLVDSDGTGYLYFGGGVPSGRNANPKTARVVKLGSDMTSLAGVPQEIDAPWILEDSGINKVGNTYYYSYCTNWAGGPLGNAKIAYMTSNSPMGPFRYQGVCLDNPGSFFGTAGNNHHSIVQFKGKSYIIYHSEWLNKKIYGSQMGYRTAHVDEISMQNGRISPARGTLKGVNQISNVNPYTVNQAENMLDQGGINVYGLGDTAVSYNRGSWTKVSKVAFGNGAKNITITAGSKNGAVIKVVEGSLNGRTIGYVTIPATNNAYSYRNVTASVNVSGTKDIYFVASGDVVVDKWQFSTSNNQPSNPEPSNPQPSNPQPSNPQPSNPQPGNSKGNVRLSDGWYYIKNVNSQKYLQVAGNRGAAGTNVEIGHGTGVQGQKWYLQNTSDGYITLKSGLGNFMLDLAYGKNENGTNLQIYNAMGHDAQKFYLQKANGNNVVTIATKVSNGSKSVDVYNFGKNDGTNVCQWSTSGNTNQQFIFEKVN
ncbi:family 43 glycosylhydrolase [Lachnobacterium bovis]|uniref:Arabinoxylan arabinofuranohydrolase n=1 Tax=Lachnobacterium bovis DSM 14045 TaxID=1122142 RepID=A0A1H3J433_9FIRM|nr:family 43 glycosylhydrolase [Lachnobacterium bovis]SDY34567.1 arabinoxylan arabinofuranohydrolase [Lachnobacterium bovis DSM 14045]